MLPGLRDRNLWAITGVKRELVASVVVVDEGLGVTSSDKVVKSRNTNREYNREQVNSCAQDDFKLGNNSGEAPNIHPSVNNTNPHVPLLMYTYLAAH